VELATLQGRRLLRRDRAHDGGPRSATITALSELVCFGLNPTGTFARSCKPTASSAGHFCSRCPKSYGPPNKNSSSWENRCRSGSSRSWLETGDLGRAGHLVACQVFGGKTLAMEPIAIHSRLGQRCRNRQGPGLLHRRARGTVRDDRPGLQLEGAWINLGTQQVHLIKASVPPTWVSTLLSRWRRGRRGGGASLEGTRSWRSRCGRVGPPDIVSDPDDNVIELHEVGGFGQ